MTPDFLAAGASLSLGGFPNARGKKPFYGLLRRILNPLTPAHRPLRPRPASGRIRVADAADFEPKIATPSGQYPPTDTGLFLMASRYPSGLSPLLANRVRHSRARAQNRSSCPNPSHSDRGIRWPS